MIRQLFIIAWNRKRRNLLITFEMAIAFLVFFGLFTVIISQFRSYSIPLGYEYDDVVSISLVGGENDFEAYQSVLQRVRDKLNSFSEVRDMASCSYNVPYNGGSFTMNKTLESGEEVGFELFCTSAEIRNVLKISLVEGTWFEDLEDHGEYTPVVINKKLKEALFGSENALGEVLQDWRIVGVMDHYRLHGELEDETNMCIAPANWMGNSNSIMVRSQSGKLPALKARIEGELARYLVGYELYTVSLKSKREDYIKQNLIPIIIFLLLCGFLIFSVSLGLFGVLWNNLKRLRSEIGLRVALGADSKKIMLQFTGEPLVLALFSLSLGWVVSLQFPLLGVFGVANHIYMMAMLAATVAIFAMVLLCSLYPSWQAAKTSPARALGDE